MKIIAFDVRDYELQDFQNDKRDITLRPEPLNFNNAYLTEGYDAVTVLAMSVLNSEMLKILAKNGVKYVATRTVGYNQIDLKTAKECNIRISNARYAPHNVADFTVMLMLMLLRKAKVSVCRALVNDFSLDGMGGRELRSLTVGLIGAGKIGKTVAQNLSGFGCKILAYDPYVSQDQIPNATLVSLDELLHNSDIVSLHTPLTPENKHLIDKTALAKMKEDAILINTARGELVCTKDLIEALENGRLGGAGIDTVEEEAGVCHVDLGTRIVNKRDLLYLKQFPNVILTPHYAYFTQEATSAMVQSSLNAFTCYENGEENPYEII